jgi:hypothetical protein
MVRNMLQESTSKLDLEPILPSVPAAVISLNDGNIIAFATFECSDKASKKDRA